MLNWKRPLTTLVVCALPLPALGIGAVAAHAPEPSIVAARAAKAKHERRDERRTTGRIAGRILDIDGNPIEGVRVSTDEGEAVTNADGAFSLGSLTPGRWRLELEHPDYLIHRRGVEVGAGRTTRITNYLLEHRPAHHVQADREFTLVEGPIQVWFPANALVYADDGTAVAGDAEIEVTPIEPYRRHVLEAAPAPLVGIGDDGWTLPLESFMMFHVEMRQGERELELAPDLSVAVSMRLPAGSTLEPGETVPMWSADLEQNLWVSEDADAVAVEQADGSLTLETVLNHFSDWNADRTVTTVVSRAEVWPSLSSTKKYAFQSGDEIHLRQTDSSGRETDANGQPTVQSPYLVYSTPVTSDTSFSINMPQCGMKGTWFRLVLHKGTGEDCALYGNSSSTNRDGAYLKYSTYDPNPNNGSTTDVNYFYSVDGVCAFLEGGGAHGTESEQQKYSSTCDNSRTNCDGSTCKGSTYQYGGSDYPLGDCATMDKSSDGLDGVGMTMSSGLESFTTWRLPMTLYVGACVTDDEAISSADAQ